MKSGPRHSRKSSNPCPISNLSLLDEEDFQLGDIMDRLKRLDVYEPIMHFGWTQATWPDEETEAIPLHRLARRPLGWMAALTFT